MLKFQKTFLWAVKAICLMDKLLSLIFTLHFNKHPCIWQWLKMLFFKEWVKFSNMNTKPIIDYIGSIHLFLKDLALNKERTSATFMRCSVKQKPVPHKQRAVTCPSTLLITQNKFHTFSAYFSRCNLFKKL